MVVLASLAAAALAGGAFACSAPPASQSADINEGAELAIQFPTMYSAFESTHDYKIPAMVTGVKKVKWSIDDPDAADLEPGSDGTSVTITVRKAGDFTITAKAGSLVGHAPLHVTDASPDDWSDGDKRYNDGVMIQRPQGRPDGGHGGYPAPDKQAA